jgi:Arc/MetJ-type ribon-helix-helix transcriptional regulator
MREVKLRLPESELQLIDNLVKEKNTTRSSFIRSKLRVSGLKPEKIQQISNAIRARANAGLSKQQADHCAAIAINALIDDSP